MSPHVANSLRECIPGSEATIFYLKLCYYVTSAFLDPKLSPLERIYRMWFPIFFLRIWRCWILQLESSKEPTVYCLQDNFITMNANECIELNGHALVQLVMKFRNENKSDLFIPFLFSSQPCESTFRQFRSMTSIYWTKINSSLLELFHTVGRIELQNYIMYYKAPGVIFPRQENKTSKMDFHEMPSDQEIFDRMNTARDDALIAATALGLKIPPEEDLSCKIPASEFRPEELNEEIDPLASHANKENAADAESLSVDIQNLHMEEMQEALSANPLLAIRDYSEQNIPLTETCPFIKVSDTKGNVKIVRKSSALWALTNSKSKLSNDRLKRVQQDAIERASGKLNKIEQVNSNVSPEVLVSRQEMLNIGDWSYFVHGKSKKYTQSLNELYVGQVLGFKYIIGKTAKEKQYSRNNAPVNPNIASKLRRGIEVQATWYKYNENGSLLPIDSTAKHFFINIENYIGTTKTIEQTAHGKFQVKMVSTKLIYFNQQLLNLLSV